MKNHVEKFILQIAKETKNEEKHFCFVVNKNDIKKTITACLKNDIIYSGQEYVGGYAIFTIHFNYSLAKVLKYF